MKQLVDLGSCDKHIYWGRSHPR